MGHGQPNDEDASLSPSLRETTVGKPPAAYELKFLLREDRAREVEQMLLRTLLPDPHCDPALGGMYAITSLACDAPDFPVFFRDKRVRNQKFRVRRYGASDLIYLERKKSKDGRVRKRRVEASQTDLAAIAEGRNDLAGHAWFVREVQATDLRPVCVLRYLRRALFGMSDEGPMRVTFDRSIRGRLTRDWSFDATGDERGVLPEFVVCEFKFQSAMPSPMKAVVAALGLESTGCSKYRTCVRAFAAELGIREANASPSCDPVTGVNVA